ncbi:CDP-glycerol glycerophosphotransferase family protein [Roseococcus pinisoli]|uniref:CDP-glycerol glycerophosphotransferase family protein n=1 Tax=Roseococcus pinisoli TaxID=2835040 RepID=A0ABS5QJF7_9PROT|nr:CDP-glycerol glycerophosphotransferase family protein [Roseococcus pinisoli]MBS7813774.1 CDP-glycerol glycerophosphotransferase family protein [Roseococcus pinisoli]
MSTDEVNSVTSDQEKVANFSSIPSKAGADLGSVGDTHFIFDIEHVPNAVKFYVVTAAKNAVPARILRRGKTSSSDCFTRIIARDKQTSIYTWQIDTASLTEPCRFFCRRDGHWVRLLQPYHANLTLPEGFGFSAHHLYLTYGFAPPDHPVPKMRAFIRTAAADDQKLSIQGALISNIPIEAFKFVIRKFRDEAHSWEASSTANLAHRVWGVHVDCYRAYRSEMAYKFDISIDLSWKNLPNSIYSLMIHVDDLVSGLFKYNSAFSKKNNLFDVGGSTVYIYVDSNAKNLRFDKYSFGSEKWAGLIDIAASNIQAEAVCLIGEYTNSARDNGLHLFQHLRERERIKTLYVIEKDSDISGEGVLDFGSYEHIRQALEAKVVAFTHHPHYVLPRLAEALRRHRPAKTLFLQHGVTALKNSMDAYHVNRGRFDLFNVCSQNEKRFIASACGYDYDAITVSGFPRLDKLYRESRAHNGQSDNILIFPTWRRSLDKKSASEFALTGFFKSWVALCDTARRETKILNGKLIFVSHPIISKHKDMFRAHVDDIVSVDDIQSLLTQCAFLVTDYSSIAFDAVFAGRPVYFYTFDAEEFRFKQDAFIDVDNDLPGFRSNLPDAIVDDIKRNWKNRGRIHSKYSGKIELFFDHVDDRNCLRIEKAIESLIGLPLKSGLP